MGQLKMVRATAPIRRFDIGQWTDCWFAGAGSTFNFAGWPGVHVFAREKPPTRQKKGSLFGYPCIIDIPDMSVTIHAKDVGERIHINDCREIEYNGSHDLLKAAVKRIELGQGAEIFIRSDVPPACGVGSSAAIAVALVGALDLLNSGRRSNREIAGLAQKLEIEELKIECGIQDQHGCALGGAWGAGIFVMHQFPNDVEIVPLPLHRIPETTFRELSERLVLVYVGPRISSEVHKQVISNITAGEKKSLKALDTLRAQPARMVEALIRRDFKEIADVMMTNWQAQQNLHPAIGSSILKEVESVALKYGAMAVKANGAGGGGSMEVLVTPGKEHDVREAIKEIEGNQILESSLTPQGLRTWFV